jgi:hypothetical protein
MFQDVNSKQKQASSKQQQAPEEQQQLAPDGPQQQEASTKTRAKRSTTAAAAASIEQQAGSSKTRRSSQRLSQAPPPAAAPDSADDPDDQAAAAAAVVPVNGTDSRLAKLGVVDAEAAPMFLERVVLWWCGIPDASSDHWDLQTILHAYAGVRFPDIQHSTTHIMVSGISEHNWTLGINCGLTWVCLGVPGNDGLYGTWAWYVVSKHIGWRPSRIVSWLSCYHICSLTFNPGACALVRPLSSHHGEAQPVA